MSGQTEEARLLAIQMSIEVHRKNKTNFFSSEWQRQQAYKGGYKGGKANTKKQFSARQKVGKTYGRDNGISNTTNPIILEVRRSYTKWNHTSGIEVIIEPKEALADIQRELQKHFYFDVKNKSAIRRIILGIKKSIGGWSYSGRAISREALDTSEEPSTTT